MADTAVRDFYDHLSACGCWDVALDLLEWLAVRDHGPGFHFGGVFVRSSRLGIEFNGRKYSFQSRLISGVFSALFPGSDERVVDKMYSRICIPSVGYAG